MIDKSGPGKIHEVIFFLVINSELLNECESIADAGITSLEQMALKLLIKERAKVLAKSSLEGGSQCTKKYFQIVFSSLYHSESSFRGRYNIP